MAPTISALVFFVCSTLVADAHGPSTLAKSSLPGGHGQSRTAPGVREVISDVFAELDDDFDARVAQPAALSADAADLLHDTTAKSLVKKPFWLTLFWDIMIFAVLAKGASRYYEESKCRQEEEEEECHVEEKESEEVAETSFCRTAKAKSCTTADYTSFMLGMQAQDEGRWRVYLQDPAITTEVDCFGCSALHVAAHCGCVEAVRELLARGADANAKEAWDETALHFAARAGSVEICQLLLDHGAEINSLNMHGQTAMLMAASSGQESTCDLLMNQGGGAGGVADSDIPPLLTVLLFKRMMTPVEKS